MSLGCSGRVGSAIRAAPNILLIPGIASSGHLRDNLAPYDGALDDQAIRDLDTVGAR